MSPFQPVEKVPASEQVASALRDSILGGEIPAGEKLPPERKLAGRFQVTRTTLREALKKLEQLRLVAIRQGQGATVRDFRDASLDLLGYLLRPGSRFDADILSNILEARVSLGAEVTRLAALRRDDDDLRMLREQLEAMEGAKTPEDLQVLDFEFFRLLAAASRNMIYILIMNTLRTVHQANLSLFRGLSADLNIKAQRRILAAVELGDAKTAAAAARTYLEKGLALSPEPDPVP